jgi:hypothetical protein
VLLEIDILEIMVAEAVLVVEEQALVVDEKVGKVLDQMVQMEQVAVGDHLTVHIQVLAVMA